MSFTYSGEVLRNILENIKTRKEIEKNWKKIIKERSKFTRLVSFQKAELKVEVFNPCLLQELFLEKEKILKDFEQIFGEKIVQKIAFQAGSQTETKKK